MTYIYVAALSRFVQLRCHTAELPYHIASEGDYHSVRCALPVTGICEQIFFSVLRSYRPFVKVEATRNLIFTDL